jgi:hypothetical protein
MKTVRSLSFRLALLTLAGAAVFSTPALAGMQWKWRDAGGNIQYSDRPPPAGTPEQSILARPSVSRTVATKAADPVSGASAPAPAASAATKQPETELDVKRRKTEEDKAAKQKADEEKMAKSRADNCQRARTYLKTLSDGIRVARTNVAGEREILDDKGRADEVQRTQEIVQSNCK